MPDEKYSNKITKKIYYFNKSEDDTRSGLTTFSNTAPSKEECDDVILRQKNNITALIMAILAEDYALLR